MTIEEDKGLCGNCMETSDRTPEGKQLMVANTKGKYEQGQKHPRCQDCLEKLLDNPQLQKARLQDLKKYQDKQKERG
jgi:hypothetical protein